MIDTAAGQTERVDDEFLAVVCDDEEWLRAEFDAIIAAGWPESVPPSRGLGGGEHRFEAGPRAGGCPCVVCEVCVVERTLVVLGDDPTRDRAPPPEAG